MHGGRRELLPKTEPAVVGLRPQQDRRGFTQVRQEKLDKLLLFLHVKRCSGEVKDVSVLASHAANTDKRQGHNEWVQRSLIKNPKPVSRPPFLNVNYLLIIYFFLFVFFCFICPLKMR